MNISQMKSLIMEKWQKVTRWDAGLHAASPLGKTFFSLLTVRNLIFPKDLRNETFNGIAKRVVSIPKCYMSDILIKKKQNPNVTFFQITSLFTCTNFKNASLLINPFSNLQKLLSVLCIAMEGEKPVFTASIVNIFVCTKS